MCTPLRRAQNRPDGCCRNHEELFGDAVKNCVKTSTPDSRSGAEEAWALHLSVKDDKTAVTVLRRTFSVFAVSYILHDITRGHLLQGQVHWQDKVSSSWCCLSSNQLEKPSLLSGLKTHWAPLSTKRSWLTRCHSPQCHLWNRGLGMFQPDTMSRLELRRCVPPTTAG